MTRSVLHVLGPSTGGIRRHVATLADGLEDRGWTTSVAGPPGVMDGLRAGQVDVPVSNRPSVAGLRSLRALARDADVVHAHGLTAGWWSWLAGTGDRLVLTVHNLVLREASGRATPILRAAEGLLPGRAAQTIVISEEMRRRFDPSGADPTITLIPPVGPVPVVTRSPGEVRAELGIHPHAPLVVLVGRLHPQKDIGTLIDAVASLPTGTEVVVVGDGPERARLTQRVAELGLSERVHLVGARTDATNYQAAADVVVMCSIWEGFGLVVAEALALGRPVVATAVGPVPSMVIDGETGRLVPPSDPPALAAAITDLLRNPEDAQIMGRAGAKLVEPHFDIPALIARVEDIYDLVTKPVPA